jgi:hypothetical protein
LGELLRGLCVLGRRECKLARYRLTLGFPCILAVARPIPAPAASPRPGRLGQQQQRRQGHQRSLASPSSRSEMHSCRCRARTAGGHDSDKLLTEAAAPCGSRLQVAAGCSQHPVAAPISLHWQPCAKPSSWSRPAAQAELRSRLRIQEDRQLAVRREEGGQEGGIAPQEGAARARHIVASKLHRCRSPAEGVRALATLPRGGCRRWSNDRPRTWRQSCAGTSSPLGHEPPSPLRERAYSEGCST